MNNSILRRRLTRGVSSVVAVFLFGGAGLALSSCQDDLLTGTPSWLGSSIYEELESRGSFKHTLALINDPDLSETNYPDLLRRTGSMTMFVAEDAAWDKFLAKRGLSSVNQLPKSEKKNLLKSAMINNAYLIELLSNIAGDPPVEGACLRRTSRMDITDSLPEVVNADFPAVNPARYESDGMQIDYWAEVRDRASIKLYKDNTAAPMVHFLPEYMSQNNITDLDLDMLTNGAAKTTDRSYINGLPIALNEGKWSKDEGKTYLQDITCQNGYIHILTDVPEPLGNMAEIIASKPQFSTFSELLERYSYPYFLSVQTLDGREDSLFVKRYFNTAGNHDLKTVVETNRSVNGISFDPGWNQYVLFTSGNRYSMAEDGAAMFVPTNEWMDYYLHHDGAAIGLKYGYDWRNVPDNVVLPFINNCLQSSFRGTVPSKFRSLKNTAAENMGITVDDIDSCFMACNGVVYQVNKVFVAPEHQSVFFPAVLRADQDLSVLYTTVADKRYENHATWTIAGEYSSYLNSMASSYSFLIPNDKAFLTYIDPVSYAYGQTEHTAMRFYLDPTQRILPVSAQAFKVDSLGNVTDELATNQPTMAMINNRLRDILENIIIVHGQRGTRTFHEGQTIYLNKAGSPITVRFEGGKVTGIAGSRQAETGSFTKIDEEQIFDQTESGNGVAYILDTIPQTTLVSPYKAISDTIAHPEFAGFNRLLGSATFVSTAGSSVEGHTTVDRAITTMSNFHYTIYVPTNDVIVALEQSGKLPSHERAEAWEDYLDAISDYQTTHARDLTDEQAEELDRLTDYGTEMKERIQSVIDNFVRYHIQDNSIYLGGTDSTGVYETAAVDTTLNRFRRLTVSNYQRQIRVTDASGHAANVIDGPHSNLMTRQYYFTSSNRTIYGTSSAVVHLIDNVLSYGDAMFLPSDFPDPPAFPDWMTEGETKSTTNYTRRR
ncbi:MAG: hypothetical protein IJ209_10555 [Bacteroidaceae bacterium]|nr:hypothetical protein [Bacteroidaceae bacterium]